MKFLIDYTIDAPEETRAEWAKRTAAVGTANDQYRTRQNAIESLDREYDWAWDGDRLSDDRVKVLIKGVEWPIYAQDVIDKRSSFTERPIEQTMQGLTIPMVREVLRRDPTVNRILEIGANYGYILSVIAREFPHINVHGSDLPWAMVQMNEEFQEPNLSFSSGYPLADLEAGKISGDLIITVSTAVRIRGAEFKRYLDVLAQTGARWFVANEVMIPHQNGVVPDPSKIDPDNSVPVVYANSGSGMPPCYAHNYRAIFESKGWTIEHYRLYAPLAPEQYRLELVARR